MLTILPPCHGRHHSARADPFSHGTSEDLLGLILFASHTDAIEGAVNAVAPHAVTSLEYARVLGRVISRPSFAPLPAFVLRTMFGEFADGALLDSQRVLPKRLTDAGFRFVHPMLADALRFTLGR